MDEIVALRKANPGGGPHSVTGPIYVNGAEPGDVMEIRILKITPKAFGTNFNLPGKEFPTIGALASEMPDGFVKYFYLDLDKKPGRVQARHHDRPAAVPGHARGRHRSQGPLAAQGRLDGSDGAGLHAPAVEERLEHGHQRAAGGLDHLHPDLPQGRARLDGRLALPPGQRRGEPHRARVLLPRDRHAAHRAQGHEARVAAHRDPDPLDHDRASTRT